MNGTHKRKKGFLKTPIMGEGGSSPALLVGARDRKNVGYDKRPLFSSGGGGKTCQRTLRTLWKRFETGGGGGKPAQGRKDPFASTGKKGVNFKGEKGIDARRPKSWGEDLPKRGKGAGGETPSVSFLAKRGDLGDWEKGGIPGGGMFSRGNKG